MIRRRDSPVVMDGLPHICAIVLILSRRRNSFERVILLELRRRRERSDWLRGTQQIGEDDGGVELALLNRAEHAGEHLVRVGAACGAVATTDFAGDDGRAQGLCRAPVGRVDRRVEQKREDCRVLDREMRGKALNDAATARLIDESNEPILEMTADDGDAVCGDGPAHPQSLLEDGLHPLGKLVFVLVANQPSTSSQQMRGMPMSAFCSVCQLLEYADPRHLSLRLSPPRVVTEPM